MMVFRCILHVPTSVILLENLKMFTIAVSTQKKNYDKHYKNNKSTFSK